jgi:hypothetical protein
VHGDEISRCSIDAYGDSALRMGDNSFALLKRLTARNATVAILQQLNFALQKTMFMNASIIDTFQSKCNLAARETPRLP